MTISNYIEELIYRVLAGDASEEERCELEAWVRESEEHRVFFQGGAGLVHGEVCREVEKRGDEFRVESCGA